MLILYTECAFVHVCFVLVLVLSRPLSCHWSVIHFVRLFCVWSFTLTHVSGYTYNDLVYACVFTPDYDLLVALNKSNDESTHLSCLQSATPLATQLRLKLK